MLEDKEVGRIAYLIGQPRTALSPEAQAGYDEAKRDAENAAARRRSDPEAAEAWLKARGKAFDRILWGSDEEEQNG